MRCSIARVPVLASLTPAITPISTPKNTGIYAEPSNSTSTISPINPGSQPRNDTGNEALGRAGIEEGKVRHADFLRNVHQANGFGICPQRYGIAIISEEG